MLHRLFATPPDDSLQEHIAQNSGLAFNGGRPPPTEWMMPRAEHKHVKARLTQLGNAVIPLQAIVAARLLSSAVFCPRLVHRAPGGTSRFECARGDFYFALPHALE